MRDLGIRKRIVQWLQREFVCISCEGSGSGTAIDQMEGIFDRITTELQEDGLSLDKTIRTRLWAADRKSRDIGSTVRAKYNVGQARAATSSYITPSHFASNAMVGLDLIVLKPAIKTLQKIIVEFVPPRIPINYLIFDSLLVLSGRTGGLPTLSEQLDEILPGITSILNQAGSSWDRVVNVSCYLHRTQSIETLRRGFAKWGAVPLSRMEIAAVEGYASEGKLLEVEVTAQIPR